MLIKPTKGAKSLWEIDEDVAMEALIYNRGEAAMPWDSDLTVEGDKVILIGSIGGSDANRYDKAGYCRCECSVDNFTSYYELEVPDEFLDEDTMEKLFAGGWRDATS